MRVEGWLQHKSGFAPFVRRYVVIDGYVFRAFAEEPTLSDTPAAFIIDLRMIEALKPTDVHAPSGPCSLTAKGFAGKSCTISPEHVVGQTDEDNWWLPVIAAAVPDRSCATSIRARFRRGETVLALMREHAMQPSAHQMSDAQWRTQRGKDKAKAARKSNASSPGSSVTRRASSILAYGLSVITSPRRRSSGSVSYQSSPRAGSATTPSPQSAVAARLAKARDRKFSGADSDEPAEAASPAADAPAAAAEPAPLSLDTVVVATRNTDWHSVPASLRAEGSERGAQIQIATASARRSAQEAASAERAAAKEEDAEAAATAAADVAAAEEEVEGGGWWFVKRGAEVTGPHRPSEMRRRYLAGKVTHATLVRFLIDDDEPAADEHVGQPFSELQELCSADGPPFMHRIASPRR